MQLVAQYPDTAKACLNLIPDVGGNNDRHDHIQVVVGTGVCVVIDRYEKQV